MHVRQDGAFRALDRLIDDRRRRTLQRVGGKEMPERDMALEREIPMPRHIVAATHPDRHGRIERLEVQKGARNRARGV